MLTINSYIYSPYTTSAEPTKGQSDDTIAFSAYTTSDEQTRVEGADHHQTADVSQTESSPTEQDTEVASFFDKVRAAGGALNYIQQQNMEKIEKLIEEKRQELEARMGINAQPPLDPEALVTARASIEELLESYKKDLIENMEKRSGSGGFDEDSFLKQLIHNTPAPKADETTPSA